VSSVPFGLFTLALLIPAVVLHEIAHGYVSLRHGDPTARDAGRLSLNPLRHVDPFGAVPLPLFLSNRGLCMYYRLRQYASPVLLALLRGVPALFQVDPIGAYFAFASSNGRPRPPSCL
jgi:Zn-dependent protease